MDIFEQLDIMQKKIESTPSKMKILSPNPPNDEERPITHSDSIISSPTPSTSSISNKNKNHVELAYTTVISTDSKNLVWAPYYRFSNTLFPARLCINDEAIAAKSIPWPLQPGTVVVEIFNQEINSTTEKLLVVKKDRVFPYYKSSSSTKATGASSSAASEKIATDRWNEANLLKMKKALESKFKKSVANFIYEEIVKTANEFLQKAIKRDEEVRSLLHAESEEQNPPDNLPDEIDAKEIDSAESTPIKSKNSHLLKYALIRTSQKIPLKIGDKICYHQKMTGNECESIVEEFLDHHKVALMNGDVLKGEDLVCKMILKSSLEKSKNQEARSNDVGSLYVKDSNGYQELKSYEFIEVGVSQSKKRLNSSSNATTDENEANENTVAPSSKKKRR